MTWLGKSTRPYRVRQAHHLALELGANVRQRLHNTEGAGGVPRDRNRWIALATSYDAVYLKNRGFKMRAVTWRALSISPYLTLDIKGRRL